MAETTWKQAVYDIADAYREAEGVTDKISIANLKEKVRDGGGKVYLDGERIKQLEMTSYQGDNPYTMGQEGMSFEANTLIKEALQIINGVSGEDLTETASDQTLAVDTLLREVKRKIADHKGEGEYVWKKQTIEGGDFIGFVVSSDAEAFPDGAAADDGYWYELLSNPVDLANETDLISGNIKSGVEIFGVTGTLKSYTIKSGSVSPPAGSASSLTINHGLGTTPVAYGVSSHSGECSILITATNSILKISPYSTASFLTGTFNWFAVG